MKKKDSLNLVPLILYKNAGKIRDFTCTFFIRICRVCVHILIKLTVDVFHFLSQTFNL